jgi:hypothetical protein
VSTTTSDLHVSERKSPQTGQDCTKSCPCDIDLVTVQWSHPITDLLPYTHISVPPAAAAEQPEPPAARVRQAGRPKNARGQPGSPRARLQGGAEERRRGVGVGLDDGAGEALQRLAHPRVRAPRYGLGGGDPLPAAGAHLGPPLQLRRDAQREHEAFVRRVVAAAAVAPPAQRGARLPDHAGLLRGLAPGRLVHRLVQLPPALGDQHTPRRTLLLRADHQHLHLAAGAEAVRDAPHHDAPARAVAVPLQLPALPRHHHRRHGYWFPSLPACLKNRSFQSLSKSPACFLGWIGFLAPRVVEGE